MSLQQLRSRHGVVGRSETRPECAGRMIREGRPSLALRNARSPRSWEFPPRLAPGVTLRSRKPFPPAAHRMRTQSNPRAERNGTPWGPECLSDPSSRFFRAGPLHAGSTHSGLDRFADPATLLAWNALATICSSAARSGGNQRGIPCRDLTTGSECAIKRLRVHQDLPAETLRRDLNSFRDCGIRRSSRYSTSARRPTEPIPRHGVRPGHGSRPRIDPGRLAGRRGFRRPRRLRTRCPSWRRRRPWRPQPANLIVVPGADGSCRDIRLVDFGLAVLLGSNVGDSTARLATRRPKWPREILRPRLRTSTGWVRRCTRCSPDSSVRQRNPRGGSIAGTTHRTRLEQAGTPWPLIEFTLRLLAPNPTSARGTHARRGAISNAEFPESDALLETAWLPD